MTFHGGIQTDGEIRKDGGLDNASYSLGYVKQEARRMSFFFFSGHTVSTIVVFGPQILTSSPCTVPKFRMTRVERNKQRGGEYIKKQIHFYKTLCLVFKRFYAFRKQSKSSRRSSCPTEAR